VDPTGLAVAAVSLLEGLPASLGAVKGLRPGPGAGSTSRAGAGAAYLAYEAAASELLFHVQLIVNIGVPPSIKGGLWSYPVVYRSHQAMVDAMAAMTVAFGQMVMLGSYEVNEAAFNFGMALADVTKSLPIVGRRMRSTPDFEERVHAAQVALRAFLLAARADMEVPGPTGPEVGSSEGTSSGS